MNEIERILVILPHPDDEAFGLSATLAKYISNGAIVTYGCLTLGEMGRNMGNPPFANRVSLPHIRKQELIESCKAIGIQDLRLMGFHDKTIEFEDKELLDGAIMKLYQEIKPQLVFTFLPGFSVHPDHDACGAAVIRVIASLPANERPIVQCLGFSHDVETINGKPDAVYEISEFLGHKKASIEAHQSQFQIEQMFGTLSVDSPEIKEKFGKEHFWTYSFEAFQ